MSDCAIYGDVPRELSVGKPKPNIKYQTDSDTEDDLLTRPSEALLTKSVCKCQWKTLQTFTYEQNYITISVLKQFMKQSDKTQQLGCSCLYVGLCVKKYTLKF